MHCVSVFRRLPTLLVEQNVCVYLQMYAHILFNQSGEKAMEHTHTQCITDKLFLYLVWRLCTMYKFNFLFNELCKEA